MTRRRFGGQALGVVLMNEAQLRRLPNAEPVSDDDIVGSPELNEVLDRALDDSFIYLRHLQEYDDTIFNHSQMSDVIPELERLRGFAEGSEVEVVDRVIALAKRVEPGEYLLFAGD
jgi:hypothetical protein